MCVITCTKRNFHGFASPQNNAWLRLRVMRLILNIIFGGVIIALAY